MENFVPLPYRRVSYQKVPVSLEAELIQNYLVGKEAYRRTEFIILRSEVEKMNQFAVVHIQKQQSDASLFSPIESVQIISPPLECRYYHDTSVDTGIPSSLAEAAAKYGVTKNQTLIVEGAFGHINFYRHPNPITLTLVDLIPPSPSRLLYMVEQILKTEDFPPIRVKLDLIDTTKLAEQSGNHPTLLFPCRGSGIETGPSTQYLDEHPPLQNWVLVGCERSEAIYRHFYGQQPERIDTCPQNLRNQSHELTLMRCCLFESEFKINQSRAVVPWGADIPMIKKALKKLIASVESAQNRSRKSK